MLLEEIIVRSRMKRHPWSTAVAAALLLLEAPAHAAEPTTADCLAASDASLKLGNQHKHRAERSQLLVCAAAACPSEIRNECIRRADEANAQIPTILFEARDASGATLNAVKVTMDGEVLAEHLDGTALPVDPGEHTFTFETATEIPVTKTLTIQESQKERREGITFVAPTAALRPSQAPQSTGGQQLPENPPAARVGRQPLGTQKSVAIVAGGVGLVGLGVGTAFGVVAMSQKSAAQSACPTNPCGTQDGVNRWNNAGSTGNVSTIGFIVGALGVGGAAILWLTAPASVSAQLGVGPGVLQVKGAW
jgi:hypothetical protein